MTFDSEDLALRSKTIGGLIREARKAEGRSLEECARAIGVSDEVYVDYETGKQAISLPALEGLAYFFEIPVEHFWVAQTNSEGEEEQKALDLQRVFQLRHRMIGAQLRQARQEAGLSLDALAEQTGIDVEVLQTYELGREPVPVPVLEMLSALLNRSIREFQDRHGPVGTWEAKQQAVRDFQSLPLELQTFISKPINRPYLELAVRLSEMTVDRLRAVAEGLLEITY